ncbi:MAG TPA: type II toxin-antitoxin system VapC family toxin [Candidatus Xenobia bacterium]|nr:type II toxin-antitoxin system VapC family toxin [Candidatus Xenobia bacterium]
MKRYVLDANALMALFEDRPGAEKVQELIARAAETQNFLLMSVVNWGEVYYSYWRDRGEDVANDRIRTIAQLPIEVVDVDMEVTRLAASLKARHKLPYADCFAAALATTRRAQLVTGDHDFRALDSSVQVHWLDSK